jgi:hypothetical protein
MPQPDYEPIVRYDGMALRGKIMRPPPTASKIRRRPTASADRSDGAAILFMRRDNSNESPAIRRTTGWMRPIKEKLQPKQPAEGRIKQHHCRENCVDIKERPCPLLATDIPLDRPGGFAPNVISPCARNAYQKDTAAICRTRHATFAPNAMWK